MKTRQTTNQNHRRTHLWFNQIAADLIIKILNRFPLDALLLVLVLLGAQRQIDEDLLELLVHKVDAELLKAVFLRKDKFERKMLVPKQVSAVFGFLNARCSCVCMIDRQYHIAAVVWRACACVYVFYTYV